MKNKKLSNIAKAVGAFILLLALCASGVLFFHTYYYDLIYVSGGSMYPTLNKNSTGEESETVGSVVDFGIIDSHSSALKHIKRFDIVSTYYPDSSDYDYEINPNKPVLKTGAKKKIKRIIALPNETFIIEKGLLYILRDGKYKLEPYTFNTNPAADSGYEGKETDPDHPITLKSNEYWVLGDNRSASRDCQTIGKPVTYENLIGVLVAIEGTGSLYAKDYLCEKCGKRYPIKNGNVCKKDNVAMKIEYDVNKKHYHWPKYF